MKKKERRSPEEEINIIPLLKAILKKWWLIALAGLLLGGIAFGAARLILKPTYRSGFTAYVNNQQNQSSRESVTASDVNASKQILETYIRIVGSNRVLTAAAKSINMDLPFSQLSKMVSAEAQGETEIIYVYVTAKDPDTAYELADAIAKVSPSHMADIVEGSSMKIIDYPVLKTERTGPNYLKYAIIGFLLGALIIVIKTIIEYFKDDKVRDEQELETRFGIPILGVIPDLMNIGKSSSSYYYSNSYGGYEKASRSEGKNEKK